MFYQSVRRLCSMAICTMSCVTQVYAEPVSEPQPVTMTLPDSYYVDWQVAKQDAPYRVFISVPEDEAPADGFPVVYLMDGNAFFSSAVITSKKLMHPRFENKQPAIIVGLGYPIEGTHDTERRWLDLTPPTLAPPVMPKKHMERFKDMTFGGGKQTLSLLVDDIRPWLIKQYPINEDQQILFGHSLGGLFTLYALNTRPEAFNGYSAISPSLWWNNGYLKPLLAKQESTSRTDKQIFIVMGEQEADYMLEDAQWAQDRFTEQGLHSEYRILPYMNHGTVAPPALTMALEKLLPEKPEITAPES